MLWLLLGPPEFTFWISFALVFSFIFCSVLIFAVSPFYILIYMFSVMMHWYVMGLSWKPNIFLSFFLFILPYALTDILGRLAQRLLVQDSKEGRIIVQRFKSIKVKDKNR